jgi:hypothetical protein
MIDLPFVYPQSVCHIGDPQFLQPRPTERFHTKGWDYEFGLFSVSLDPEAWRLNWAGPGGVICELTVPDRPFRLLDADLALVQHRGAIEQAALRANLIDRPDGALVATSRLYAALRLTEPSQLPLGNRPFADQALQASLAVLAAADPGIDGLWWSDMLDGEMRTVRGGLYQHRLDTFSCAFVQRPSTTGALQTMIEPSAVLD